MALAIAANLLILIALLTLNAPPAPPRFKGGPILLDLSPEIAAAPDAEPSEAPVKPKPVPRSDPPPPLPTVEPPPLPSENPLPFIAITREEFAASDLARFEGSSAAGAAGEKSASTAGDSQRVGTAPDGEPLYNAEWYRRPTPAELSPYLPARMPKEGWGLVACKTAARFQVEDCVELDSSPPGSRLAGAVRQAAWQFRVRPPRIGGKELIGTWVRIRIEYSESAVQ
jgi:protein TonB